MITATNHVIVGPHLHCAGPLALWRFSLHLSAKWCRPKKVLHLSAEPLAGTVPMLCKSGSDGYCIMFIKRLDESRGGVEDTRLEAKAKDTKKIFSSDLHKKRFPKFISSAPRYFNNPKTSAVLEPRTGQFSRT